MQYFSELPSPHEANGNKHDLNQQRSLLCQTSLMSISFARNCQLPQQPSISIQAPLVLYQPAFYRPNKNASNMNTNMAVWERPSGMLLLLFLAMHASTLH